MPDAQGCQSFLEEERWSFWRSGLQKKKQKKTQENPPPGPTQRRAGSFYANQTSVREPKHRLEEDQRGYLTQLRIKGRLTFVWIPLTVESKTIF